MNFYIDIIDTTTNTYVTNIEYAEKDSIKLKYQGSDAKDELVLVGSVLDFTLEVPHTNHADAVFLALFTGDENKFKVELKDFDTNKLIWSGFILPDSYQEPYRNGVNYVSFTAVDGLGRLKGKDLPDTYYELEYNVVDIVAKCLALTGLNMSIIFAPGVDNSSVKNWHEIYINTVNFLEKDKKLNAYKILEILCKDMVMCIYQQNNHWYCEGINKHNVVTYESRKYTSEGVFVNIETVTKKTHIIKPNILSAPGIVMVPPFNQIIVNTEVQPIALPETVYKEKNYGWVVPDEANNKIFASEWISNSFNFVAEANIPGYNVRLKMSNSAALNLDHNVYLKDLIYVKKGLNLKFTAKFSLQTSGNPSSDQINDLVSSGAWSNIFRYQVLVGDTVIFTNNVTNPSFNQSIKFSRDKKAELNLSFTTLFAGDLNIRFYQPFGGVNTKKIAAVVIDTLELEEVNFKTNQTVKQLGVEGYTTKKEIDLDFYGNSSGLGKIFQLARLKTSAVNAFFYVDIPIIHNFTQNNKYYYQVNLQGAHAIKNLASAIFFNAVSVSNYSVEYNLNFGEQMVVVLDYELPPPTIANKFRARVGTYYPLGLNRDSWDKWTDSLYALEQDSYSQAVANIYNRVYNEVQQKVDLVVDKTFIQFGDIISWDYITSTVYTILNVDVNLDNGESSLRMQKASYQVVNSLVPPIVTAGETIYLGIQDGLTAISAIALDYDGVIVSVLWEQISGSPVDILYPNELNTPVGNFPDSAGVWIFQITATDNDGLTAVDTISVIKLPSYVLGYDLINQTNNIEYVDAGPAGTLKKEKRTRLYKLQSVPQLLNSEVINVQLLISARCQREGTPDIASFVKVSKNNILLGQVYLNNVGEDTLLINFNMIYSDNIEVYLESRVDSNFTYGQTGLSESKVSVNSATSAVNQVSITVPDEKVLTVTLNLG